LEGKAGSTVSLDDEWEVVGAETPKETTVSEKLSSEIEKPVSLVGGASEDGLSLVVKLLLGGVIVVACVVFIKLFASRQTGFNSKLGAYEKVGA
jgi:hypothetical protein